MMSFHTISLFTEQTGPGPRPTSFAASIFFHGLAAAVGWFSIAYTPPIAKVTTEHFAMRQLDLHTPDAQKRAAAARLAYPRPNSGAHAPASNGKAPPSVPALRQVAETRRGPQTLIQADIPNPITLTEQIPVPQVLIWSPSATPVKKIVPPMPQKPTAADVTPTAERPNEETTLADVNISASFTPSPKPIVSASTTSPVQIHAPDPVQLPPASTSQSAAQPTPASVLSLSDLRMKEGSAALPPVSESAPSNAQGILAPGQPHDDSQGGKGNPSSRPGGGSRQDPAEASNSQGSGASESPAAKANDSGYASLAGKPDGSASGAPKGTGTAGAGDNPDSATEITLPKDGHFSAVVVGASLEDQFPEMSSAWSGRVAYTVYLHVGLTRSWVLQYSLPRSDDASAGGAVARLEAPWPYNIVRPNLEPGAIDADALMVHGYVNQSGHFETLSIVFPQAFPQAQFVLAALEKWQFRPAMQDGQPAKVEVLLIIPEQLE
ncbi:MAG: hypothetical protein ACLQG3_12735 [Terracidiphilus sp.]